MARRWPYAGGLAVLLVGSGGGIAAAAVAASNVMASTPANHAASARHGAPSHRLAPSHRRAPARRQQTVVSPFAVDGPVLVERQVSSLAVQVARQVATHVHHVALLAAASGGATAGGELGATSSSGGASTTTTTVAPTTTTVAPASSVAAAAGRGGGASAPVAGGSASGGSLPVATSPPTTTTSTPTTTTTSTPPPSTTTTTSTPPPSTTTTTSPPTTTTSTPTTTTTTTPTSGSTPLVGSTGPVLAGDSKTDCIYVGWQGWGLSGIESVLQPAEQATGITFHCLESFSTSDPQWSDWVSPWVLHTNYGFGAWLASDPQNQLIITQNLIPSSVSNNTDPLTWESACDAGQYDTYATQLGQSLVSGGAAGAIIRLGQEANGTWVPDFVGSTTTEQSAWAQCFDREVAAMRSVPGQHFLFVWNPNACTQAIPFANWYPGNAYVDIIGLDQYDASCESNPPTTPSPSAFTSLEAVPDGLNALVAFAGEHGKPMALPEWGTVKTGTSPGALGDDPYYVAGMAHWVATNDVAFQSYFDNNADGILPLNESLAPKTLAAYVTAFG